MNDSPDQFLQDGTTTTDGLNLQLQNPSASSSAFLVGVSHSTGGCNLYDIELL